MVALIFIGGSVSCTKKTESSSVRIVLPAAIPALSSASNKSGAVHSAVSANNNTQPNWNTSLNPTAGSQINCFAIFVGASDLSGNTCEVSSGGTTSTISFGPNIGFVPAGQEVVLNISAGAARTFYVIGLRSQGTACKNYVGNEPDADNLSEPFLIASQVASLTAGDNTLNINATLDTDKKIASCNFIQHGSTPTGLQFGDGRDGKITLSATGQFLDQDSDAYATTPNLTHQASTVAASGVLSSKYFASTARVSNISLAGSDAGRLLTLSSPYTSPQFEVGDEVVWYVSSGASSSGSVDHPTLGACGGGFYVGRYGIAKIMGTPNTMQVLLNQPISETPLTIRNGNLAAGVGADFCRISLTRIPNFEHVKVNAGAIWTVEGMAFDQTTGRGGIMAIRTRKLEVDGTLNIVSNAKGYGGGIGGYSGSSVGGPGASGASGGNASGGGIMAGTGGGGGAGAGEGGMTTAALGGRPLNYCLDQSYSQLAAGDSHTCGRTAAGQAFCWGEGSTYGQLGEGVASSRLIPARVNASTAFQKLASGLAHTCGVDSSSQMRCWGDNSSGQIGDGTSAPRLAPTAVDSGTQYTAVTAGGQSTCGINSGGALKCWGMNGYGQLGDGSTIPRLSPVVVNSGVNYQTVSMGTFTACGITTVGVLKCWGKNNYGQVGDGTNTDRYTPVVIDSGVTYSKVAVGSSHTCGLTTAGNLKCWGANDSGQVGDGTTTQRNSPVVVSGGSGFAAISTGTAFSCGIDDDGDGYCWGNNSAGQLGVSGANRLVPTAVNTASRFSSLSTGGTHACGLSLTGNVLCWGSNSSGQLGNGTKNNSNSPVAANTQEICEPLANSKAYLGGGGAGGDTSGGSGGGIVLIFAKEVIGSGTISVQAKGANGSAGAPRATGGGGGGSVALKARAVTVTNLSINAGGGNGAGGSNGSGGGGGGIIDARYCSSQSTTLSPAQFTAVNGTAGGSGGQAGGLGRVIASDDSAVCTGE